MSLLIDIVLAGAVLGGMYALVAMGLTLQYGVARIMNLSHGESLIAAAFGGVWGLTAFAVRPIATSAYMPPRTAPARTISIRRDMFTFPSPDTREGRGGGQSIATRSTPLSGPRALTRDPTPHLG